LRGFTDAAAIANADALKHFAHGEKRSGGRDPAGRVCRNRHKAQHAMPAVRSTGSPADDERAF
jgi:hypothetical protein